MSHLGAGQFFGSVNERLSLPEAHLSRLVHEHPRRVPPHTHERPFFSFLLQGAYREQAARTLIEYEPLTLVYHPPAFEHHDEIGSLGGLFFAIEPSPAWLSFVQQETGDFPWRDLRGGPAVWRTLALYSAFHARDLSIVPDLLFDLAASSTSLRASLGSIPPLWLHRVDDCLRANPLLPLTDIAREAGVHPVHLSRTFRRFRGLSFASYRNQIRILSAARQLENRETPITSIALECGFTDQSHLTRTFKRLTGYTPAAFRRLA
jgi:AraC family transcriptional regulator